MLHPKDLSRVPARAHHEMASTNVLIAAWRRSGLIVLTVIVALAMALIALSVLKKQYRAEAILQLNLDKRESGQVDNDAAPVALDANSIVQSELKIIRSRIIARRVVDRLHLADDPRYAPPAAENAASQQGGDASASPPDLLARVEDTWHAVAGDALGWLHRTVSPSVQADIDPMTRRIEAAENDLLSHLSADTDNRSYIVTVNYTSDNPERSARIANAVAEEYIQRRIEANFDAAGKTAEWLNAQIKSTAKTLSDAEDMVEAYRAQSGLLELGTSENLDQQQLRNLSAQLSAAVLARTDAEAKLARMQDLERSGEVPSAADLQGSPLVQNLVERQAAARKDLATMLAKFGVSHPAVIQAQAGLASTNAALATELRRAVSIVQGDVAAAQRTEADVRQRLGVLQHTMIAGKTKESELRTRLAATQAIRERLETLTRSRDQALAFQQLRPVAASLIVPAEPVRSPSSPKPIIVFPLALACGLGIGLVAATMLERRDRGLRTSADVGPVTGTRCLGMVPEVSQRVLSGHGGRNDEYALQQSLLTEAARSVGAAVGLFGLARDCRVVLVTSSVNGEGKSTLCHAMAQSLVAAGQRVLLVDGWPRRVEGPPPVTMTRDMFPQAFDSQAGLLQERSLTVLQRGSSGSLATDVFSSGAFAHLLEHARKHFDVILLEGPSVMLVADSLVLGRLADTVIHVARWSNTKQRTIEAALQRLNESSIGVDGVVLTRVHLGRHAALKIADYCSYYLKERRFYQRLTGRGKARPTDLSWVG
ncbi:MAG: polysaccharide biosynthesis tyrosine autokinase [Acetobacteraceae bacterium]